MQDEPAPDLDVVRLQLEMWKHSIEVTKNFTDLSHRTRQLGITGAVGALALAVTLLTQFPAARLAMNYGGFDYETHLAGFVFVLGAVGVYITKYLDVHLHHRMLRGSVAFTQEIERGNDFKRVMGTHRGLAESISYHSRSRQTVSDDDAKPKGRKTSAERKLRKFYNTIWVAMLCMGIVVFVATFTRTRHDTVRINQTIEMPDK